MGTWAIPNNHCPNCGAPLNKYGGCDYCGSGKQSEPEKPPMPRMRWEYMGQPLYDGEAIAMLRGKPYRCQITHIEEMFCATDSFRDITGNLRRGDMSRQLKFECYCIV